jgi:hypothetical protein
MADFADLQARVEATDDRTVRAIVALAQALAAETLDRREAPELREKAELMLEALDMHAEGWRTVFTRALTREAEVLGRS